MKKVTIMGAIAGDTIGSVYEFCPTKDYMFKMFKDDMEFTDDSIMTIAVADWILNDDNLSHQELVKYMQKWGRRYPTPLGAYGGLFNDWLRTDNPAPYNSWGNGSAMRVSPVGFAFDTIEQTLDIAKVSAEVSHNHPEGIKGAQATAAALFLARTGSSKDEIREYVADTFGYDLNHACEEIRPFYGFDGSCQGTVPQSLFAFFDSFDYESAIRETVSLGGDADTMGSITGGIAAAFYKEIPDDIYDFTSSRLPDDIKTVINEFDTHFIR